MKTPEYVNYKEHQNTSPQSSHLVPMNNRLTYSSILIRSALLYKSEYLKKKNLNNQKFSKSTANKPERINKALTGLCGPRDQPRLSEIQILIFSLRKEKGKTQQKSFKTPTLFLINAEPNIVTRIQPINIKDKKKDLSVFSFNVLPS